DLIVMLAARYKLPAVYTSRPMVIGGGLICYGPDIADQFRQAAGYVDRVLKGEKPADLPVQAPTKYELVINRIASSDIVLTEQMVSPELALAYVRIRFTLSYQGTNFAPFPEWYRGNDRGWGSYV